MAKPTPATKMETVMGEIWKVLKEHRVSNREQARIAIRLVADSASNDPSPSDVFDYARNLLNRTAMRFPE